MINEANTTMVTTADAGGSAKSMSTGLTANRTYKSTMFIMLFEDKENLLELYNAISGKNYTDSEMLEINTLENAIYMTTRNENLYGTRIVQIPPPEFVVFYNGKDELPDRMERKISDMYAVSDPHAGLELTAAMLNIAGEHNRELKDACRTLGEYAVYTDKIRRYVDEMELADAVECAIQECISEGVLKDFLEKHRAEAKEMSIFEYDQEKHMRQEREAAWEDGHRTGIEEGLNNGIMLTKQVLQLSARGKSIEEIAQECSISAEQVRRILE